MPEVTEKVKVKRKGTLVKDSKQKESKKEGEFLSLESPAQDNKVIKVCFLSLLCNCYFVLFETQFRIVPNCMEETHFASKYIRFFSNELN